VAAPLAGAASCLGCQAPDQRYERLQPDESKILLLWAIVKHLSFRSPLRSCLPAIGQCRAKRSTGS
jgi:hypothetical protein